MTRRGKIVLTVILSFIILGGYYRFGYPLRNIVENSLCVNACLATAASSDREILLPTSRTMQGTPSSGCPAAIVVDNAAKEILFQKNADTVRPIASITKLMTALVLIDLDFDWSQVVKISAEDSHNSAKSRLKTGETFFATDLFFVSLICSDNRAARALARSAGVSMGRFVELMNDKAKALGLFSTEFVEVTGLSPENKSTASDCAILINAALKERLIAAACTTPQYSFRSLNHKRIRSIVNTNRLLGSDWEVAGGKTGYIASSGYCLAARLQDAGGHDITVVVLGAPGPGGRFGIARSLAQWAFRNLSRLDQESQHVAEGADKSAAD